MIQQDILDLFRLKPGKKVRLRDHDTGWAQMNVPNRKVTEATIQSLTRAGATCDRLNVSATTQKDVSKVP